MQLSNDKVAELFETLGRIDANQRTMSRDIEKLTKLNTRVASLEKSRVRLKAYASGFIAAVSLGAWRLWEYLNQ